MSKNTKIIPTFAEVKGDAIDLFFASKGNAIFMHGANCQKMMGSGIAAQVRDSIAPLYFLDQFDTRHTTQRFGSYGALVLAQSENELKIGVNLYTQYNRGQNFDMVALKTALKSFRYSITPDKRAEFTIYCPWIGCGIGGADWADVKPVLMKELAEFNVIAVEYLPTKVMEKLGKVPSPNKEE